MCPNVTLAQVAEALSEQRFEHRGAQRLNGILLMAASPPGARSSALTDMARHERLPAHFRKLFFDPALPFFLSLSVQLVSLFPLPWYSLLISPELRDVAGDVAGQMRSIPGGSKSQVPQRFRLQFASQFRIAPCAK
jgi:hypothetical protein